MGPATLNRLWAPCYEGFELPETVHKVFAFEWSAKPRLSQAAIEKEIKIKGNRGWNLLKNVTSVTGYLNEKRDGGRDGESEGTTGSGTGTGTGTGTAPTDVSATGDGGKDGFDAFDESGLEDVLRKLEAGGGGDGGDKDFGGKGRSRLAAFRQRSEKWREDQRRREKDEVNNKSNKSSSRPFKQSSREWHGSLSAGMDHARMAILGGLGMKAARTRPVSKGGGGAGSDSSDSDDAGVRRSYGAREGTVNCSPRRGRNPIRWIFKGK